LCLIALSNGEKDENEIRELNVEIKAFVKDGFFLKKAKAMSLGLTKIWFLLVEILVKGPLRLRATQDKSSRCKEMQLLKVQRLFLKQRQQT